MAESNRRLSPYNYYANNNPLRFIDPDGRRAAPIEEIDSNQPLGSLWGYYAGGGRSTFGSIEEYIGAQNPFTGLMSGSRYNPGGGGDGDLKSALEKINEFLQNRTVSVWSNISKKDFASTLINILRNPNSINQADTNLCGIAVSLKIAAELNPDKLVEIAIAIYIKGEYNSERFSIASNQDLFSKAPTNGLNAAEYIIMTSFRETLNLTSSYDPDKDNGLSGFGWPNDISTILSNWFELKDNSSTFFDKNYVSWHGYAGGINQALSSGNRVILLSNWEHFVGETSSSYTPNHYFQINSISNMNSNYTYNLGVWSWGQQKNMNISGWYLWNSTYRAYSFSK